MRALLAFFTLLLLVSCAPDSQPAVHEVNIVGSEYVRVTWFYGQPREMQLGDQPLSLVRNPDRPDGPLVVTQALSVNGEPFLRDPLPRLNRAPTEARYVAGSSDMRVVVGQNAAQVLYWDGDLWFTLLEDASAGVNTRVVPVPRLSGLQGLAQLTRSEATALQTYLESRGPAVLTVLDTLPGQPRNVAGAEEYLRSGFYIQRQIPTLAAEQRPAEEEVFFDVIASGGQAVIGDEARYVLISDEAGLRQYWNAAHASLLTPPPVPSVDFSRETVLALFMGSRPSGGYSIGLAGLSAVSGEYYADINLGEPAAGTMTSMALTSPWQMVRILRGGVNTVWLRDAATGEILGATVR